MSGAVAIRGVRIGEGIPKIIVPIVDAQREAIIEKARALAMLPIHMAEWRVDFYERFGDSESLTETLKKLRQALGDIALLFTLRTSDEGGKADVSHDEYFDIIKTAAASKLADAIDVQMLSDSGAVRKCVQIAHEHGAIVIGSNHEFNYTPDKEEIVSRLISMADMGADILKIAVMPQSGADVLKLLCATDEAHKRLPDKPLITMSMSGIGSITRVCGEVFGSAMTFASVGCGSAPGQIPLDGLTTAMSILHSAL